MRQGSKTPQLWDKRLIPFLYGLFWLVVMINPKEARLQATLADLAAERELREAVEKQLSDIQGQNHPISHGASWQYEMEGHWHPFSPEGDDQMHQAYSAYIHDAQNNRTALIVAGGVEREVDFDWMTQTHPNTGKVRKIRLVTGVPQHWVSAPADLLAQSDKVASFYVDVSDAHLIDWVTYILQSTGHAWDSTSACSHIRNAKVKSVHRIENFQLWHRYQARLTTMREDRVRYNLSVEPAALDLDGCADAMSSSQSIFDCGEPLAPDVDEKILLHGTSWDNANSIVLHGFDHRTCVSGMYGDGVYFAGAACKSHQYSCGFMCRHRSCTCERTLIIARVALGDAYYASETRYGARRPPNRSGTAGTHSSVVVKPGPMRWHPQGYQAHQEFVIFDREQAYPAFVVQYLP